MKYNSIYFFALIGWIFVSCASTSPVVLQDDIYSDFDLKSYKTFDFISIEGEDTGRPEFEENIRYLQDAISKKMVERGLRQAENPDLKINLGITVEDKVQTRETSLATDPFMYTGQRNYTWQVEEVQVGTYKEGSLTMHLVDPKKNQAAWVGSISRALPNKGKNTPSTIDDAVNLLFERIDKQ
jgi:hypothetical protein